jgi:hypothetical protein
MLSSVVVQPINLHGDMDGVSLKNAITTTIDPVPACLLRGIARDPENDPVENVLALCKTSRGILSLV